MSLSLRISVLDVLGGGRPRNRSSVEGPERTGCQEAVGPQTRGTWPRKGPRKSPGEVTAELSLEGAKEKQEGIPGRGGSLSKKGRKKKVVCTGRVCPGAAGKCKIGETRVERSAELHRPQ